MAEDVITTEIEDVLERLEAAGDQCARQLLRQEEAQKVITEARRKLEESLPSDSTAFRIYDRSKRERTLFWTVTTSGYVYPGDCKNIELWIQTIRDILNEYEPEFLRGEHVNKRQYFLSERDPYRAKMLLLKIMKRAKKSLAVIDLYLDEEIFDYIESLNETINIRLITAKQKPMFPQIYNALKTTRPNIEAKIYDHCHDRFLVIDGAEVWHLGTSINGVGKKASMVNKIVDLGERKRFLSHFNAWWSNGTII